MCCYVLLGVGVCRCVLLFVVVCCVSVGMFSYALLCVVSCCCVFAA